jgi:hypothetical protein
MFWGILSELTFNGLLGVTSQNMELFLLLTENFPQENEAHDKPKWKRLSVYSVNKHRYGKRQKGHAIA